MANVNIRLGHKNTAWFASNATLVLKDGQMVVCSDGANQGKYKIGDGTTQISALTFYGGTSFNPSGLTSQYIRGDGSYATFPTNVSSFTNDSGYITGITSGMVTTALGYTPYDSANPSGYITSSALTPYLTISNAAATYQPLDADLTSWASVTRASGFDTFVTTPSSANLSSLLTDKTGTGVTVFGTSPTFTTSILTPNVTGINGNLTFTNAAQSSGAVTSFTFTKPNNTNQTASTNIAGFLFTTGSRQWATGAITLQKEFIITAPTYSFVAPSTITDAYTLFVNAPIAGTNCTITNNFGIGTDGNLWIGGNAIYLGRTSASSSNHVLYGTSSNSYFNCASGGSLNLSVNTNLVQFYNSYQSKYTSGTFSGTLGGGGVYMITAGNSSSLTAGSEINNFQITSHTWTWNSGALPTQKFNVIKSPTIAFNSASTATNVYNLYIEAATAGTNATITNNYAAGFNGNVNILSGELRNSGTKVVGTRDTGWTAFTNTTNKGTSYDTATVTLQQLAERVAALQAALTTHGLLGV